MEREWMAVVTAKNYYDSGAGQMRMVRITAQNEQDATDAAVVAFYRSGHAVGSEEVLTVFPNPAVGLVMIFAV